MQSTDAALDLAPAAAAIAALAEKLAALPLEGRLAQDARAFAADLRSDATAPRRALDWLLGDESLAPSSPGFARYVGWTALALHLAPVVADFGAWRNEDRWLRKYCPTCGSLPAMAQLVGVDPGRIRMLSCGQCRTRWRFQRTACPFCEADTQRLAILAIEREAHLRLDHCEACRSYLKTYVGQGQEALYLADWTSLHLDLLATDRGLKRAGASLYEFELA